MQSKNIILIGILIMIFACKNDNDIQPTIEGQYIGIFERNESTSNVELNFIDGIFTGESQMEKFPAICSGNYVISNDSLKFENQCAWTAEFDWSLILSESWSYTLQNQTLTLTKSNGDKYKLTKQ